MMGLLIARFWKTKTSEEILEKLQKDIDAIEETLLWSTEKQKSVIFRLLKISALFYLFIAAISYFYLFPSTWKGRALICIPIFGIPLLVFYAKQVVSWNYTRNITKNRNKLADLLKQKKKTLEEVMNTETYKKAKEILDKYAPEQTRSQSPIVQPKVTPHVRSEPVGHVTAMKTPTGQQTLQRRTTATRSPLPQRSQMPSMLVRPIFPKDRGIFDKLVETIIGDGPNNRYALICKNCASHNGMALKEEFEYLAFRCVYCGFPNPSRKVKPRMSLGPGQFPRAILFPSDGSPTRQQASDDAAASSDSESGVKIEEVTDESLVREIDAKQELPDTVTNDSVEEEVIVAKTTSLESENGSNQTADTENISKAEASSTTEINQSESEGNK